MMLTRRKVVFVGFTLVELLVVVAICGMLVAVLLPAVRNARKQVQQKRAEEQVIQQADTRFRSGYDAVKQNMSPGDRLLLETLERIEKKLDEK